jgi:hypothetical protein
MTSEFKAETKTQPQMNLSITFQGPFLFDFKNTPANDPNATVDIYAPYCPYHEAGFFFGDSSYSETEIWSTIHGGTCPPSPTAGLSRRYVINGNGIQACGGIPVQLNPVQPPRTNPPSNNDPILKPESGDGAKIVTEKILFQVTVPRPSFIYPLYCDTVNLVKGFSTPPSQIVQVYATGLRFYYAWDNCTKIQLFCPQLDPTTKIPGFGVPQDITPPSSGNCASLPDHGDIEIRYQGLGMLDRNDRHSDARSCFANLAILAGLNEWWLNYEDRMATPSNPSRPYRPGQSFESFTGGDCLSPIVALGFPIGTTTNSIET